MSRKMIMSIGVIGATLTCLVVVLGLTQSFDEIGVRALRDGANPSNPIGADWLKPVFTAITHVGDSIFLIIISVIATVLSYRYFGRVYALRVFFAFGGVFALTPVLKALFGRMRPDIVPQFVEATSASFPSGHTLRSTVVYFLVAFLLTQRQTIQATRWKIYAPVALLVALIGISRVMLGVHWPTDVMFGWLIGISWVAGWSSHLVVDTNVRS